MINTIQYILTIATDCSHAFEPHNMDLCGIPGTTESGGLCHGKKHG